MAINIEKTLKKFGKKVKLERVRYDLSQEKLAELADIHVTTLGLIENGKMAPSLKAIVKIANALGVTLCTIMNIDE